MAIKVANNQSLTAITAIPASITGGAMTLLETQTASSSSTISFTSNIDDTYDEYVFKFYDIHPANDDIEFTFNLSIDGGSNYNVTKTTTFFYSYHNEGDSTAVLTYSASRDLAQSTAFAQLVASLGNGNDESCSGTLNLFGLSDTTFVKHFISNIQMYDYGNGSRNWFLAGYGNTTSAVNAIRFQMSSGNIDSGVIKLYGIS